MEITRTEMRRILEGVNNPDMISFISLTPEKMNQYLNYWITDEGGKKCKNPNPTPNPYFEMGIFNLSRKYKIITGFDYGKSVNRRREKEERPTDFVPKENWFEVISKGLVTDKKTHTKYYLRYQFLEDSTISCEYRFNGDTIEKRLFESYLTKKSEGYKNQGLDDELMFQVCDLDNILEISMGKEHYILVD